MQWNANGLLIHCIFTVSSYISLSFSLYSNKASKTNFKKLSYPIFLSLLFLIFTLTFKRLIFRCFITGISGIVVCVLAIAILVAAALLLLLLYLRNAWICFALILPFRMPLCYRYISLVHFATTMKYTHTHNHTEKNQLTICTVLFYASFFFQFQLSHKALVHSHIHSDKLIHTRTHTRTHTDIRTLALGSDVNDNNNNSNNNDDDSEKHTQQQWTTTRTWSRTETPLKRGNQLKKQWKTACSWASGKM